MTDHTYDNSTVPTGTRAALSRLVKRQIQESQDQYHEMRSFADSVLSKLRGGRSTRTSQPINPVTYTATSGWTNSTPNTIDRGYCYDPPSQSDYTDPSAPPLPPRPTQSTASAQSYSTGVMGTSPGRSHPTGHYSSSVHSSRSSRSGYDDTHVQQPSSGTWKDSYGSTAPTRNPSYGTSGHGNANTNTTPTTNQGQRLKRGGGPQLDSAADTAAYGSLALAYGQSGNGGTGTGTGSNYHGSGGMSTGAQSGDGGGGGGGGGSGFASAIGSVLEAILK